MCNKQISLFNEVPQKVPSFSSWACGIVLYQIRSNLNMRSEDDFGVWCIFTNMGNNARNCVFKNLEYIIEFYITTFFFLPCGSSIIITSEVLMGPLSSNQNRFTLSSDQSINTCLSSSFKRILGSATP